MERKRGLSKTQKFCTVALWVLLCLILFLAPSNKSILENIVIAIVSGIIIIVGINAGQNKVYRSNLNRNRNRKR